MPEAGRSVDPRGVVLVAGASGLLGGMVARDRLAAGERVRVISRRAGALATLGMLGAETIEADMNDRDALAHACRGVHRVFTSAHGFVVRDSRSIDLHGNRNLIDAARAAGVRHLVFTSVRMNSVMRSIDFMTFKGETEAYLRASGLSYMILKPTAFMDSWADIVGASLEAETPVTVFGDGRNPVNFVAARDVAVVACGALARAEPRTEEIEIGGPENIGLKDFVTRIAGALEAPVRLRHVPAPLARLQGTLLRQFRPVQARFLLTGYAMAASDQTFAFVTGRPGQDLPLTPLNRWIREHWLPAMKRKQASPQQV